MRNVILVTLILLLSLNIVLSEDNPTPQFNFMMDFINSLGWINGSFQRIKMSADNSDTKSSDVEASMELMTGLKRANTDLEMAKGAIDKHKNSQIKTHGDNLVAEAATYIVLICDNLIACNDQGIKKIEELYSPKNLKNPEHFDVGKYMGEYSELNARKQDIMSQLPMVTVLATNALVSEIPGKQNTMDMLLITSSEKKQIMDDLVSNFGIDVQKGIQAGQDYVTASAAAIYQMLNDNWNTANKK